MVEGYGALGALAGVVSCVYLATAFTLGARLVAKGRRTGELPEVLLGAHLVLAMGFAYVLLSVAHVLGDPALAPAPAWLPWLVGVGYAGLICGLGATLGFNLRVFWPARGWARALAAGIAGLMVLGWAAFGARDGFPAAMEGGAFWTMMGGILAANAWVAFEPLRYGRVMRRRERLGLADPLVVDRFFLWGVGSLLRVAMVLVSLVAVPLQHQLGAAAVRVLSVSVLVATSLCGLGTSVCYWLAFRPTPAYRRLVARRAARRARAAAR